MSKKFELPLSLRRIPTLTLLLIAGFPLRAWKSTVGWTNSPHSKISNAALDVLRVSIPQGRAEWDRFGDTLAHTSGWLNNDSNAHGNLLWNNEREDPSGESADAFQNNKWNPINFNGGPFYRWWIRALQAEDLCSSTFQFAVSEVPGGGLVPLPDIHLRTAP